MVSVQKVLLVLFLWEQMVQAVLVVQVAVRVMAMEQVEMVLVVAELMQPL
jgi:hypothetical protein